MKNKTEHREIFGPGGCLTKNAIQLFIDSELTDIELKKIKQHTKQCSLCAESIEGATYFLSGNSYSNRVNKMYQSSFRRSLENDGKTRKLFYGITSAAASVALLFGIYYILQLKEVVVDKTKIAENMEQNESAPVTQSISDSVVLEQKNVETETNTLSDKSFKEESEQSQVPKEPKRIRDDLKISEPEVIIGEPEITFDDSEDDFEYSVMDFEKSEEEPKELTENFSSESAVSSMSGNRMGNLSDSNEEIQKPSRKKASSSIRSFKKSERTLSKSTYYVAEVMPMFQGGGMDEFSTYIADSLKVILPDTVFRQSIVVGFRIDTMGNVDKVKLISGTDSDILNNQVLQIIENSPQWIPASISGKPVESEQEIEVVLGK